MNFIFDRSKIAVAAFFFSILTFGLTAYANSEQQCITSSEFGFKPKTDSFGMASWINPTPEGEIPKALTVAVKKPLPAIIIQGREAASQSNPKNLDWRLNGYTVQAEINPPLRIAGTTVEFNQGEAIFNALTLQEGPGPGKRRNGFTITFTCTDLAGVETKLTTGEITVVDDEADILEREATPVKGGLSLGSYGFHRENYSPQSVPIITGEDRDQGRLFPLPPFWIILKNEFGYPATSVPASTRLGVEVLCYTSNDLGESVSLPQAGWACIGTAEECTAANCGSFGLASCPSLMTFGTNSVLKMDNVYVFSKALADEGFRYTLKVSVTATLNSGAPFDDLKEIGGNTGITAQLELARNQVMLFDASSAVSHFTNDNIGNTAVLNVSLPPIVLRFFTSKMQPDVSNTGLVIQATTHQGVLQGGEALVVQGAATFSDLKFIGTYAPRSATITFTSAQLGSQGGQVVSSGPVSVAVTAIKAKHLSFAPASFTQENTPRALMVSADNKVKIKSCVVQMKDSAYQIDSTANDIEFVASISDGADVGGKQPIRVMSGIGATDKAKDFTLANVGASAFVTISDPRGIRADLTSAPFTLVKTVASGLSAASTTPSLIGCGTTASGPSDCYFRLQFGHPALSFVNQEDQDIFATVLAPLPEIRVKLQNIFEVDDLTPPADDDFPILYVYTGNDPSETEEKFLDQGENRAQVTGERIGKTWEYSFKKITFQTQPSGLVRLQFQIYAGTRPIDKIPVIRSGFVSVVESTTSNFGLRFANNNDAPSLITYPGQPTSAVVNIALPPIVVEVVNSDNNLDEATDDVTIVATVTGGLLHADGASETTSKGRATFSTLKFSGVVDNPIITFTARQSVSAYPVAGKFITTGRITLTRLPIPFFSIAFAYEQDATNQVTREYWSGSTTSVKTRLNVVDSAHQVQFDVDDVTVTPTRYDAATGTSGSSLTSQSFTDSGTYRSAALFDIPITAGSSDQMFTFTAAIDPSSTKTLLSGRELTIGPIRNIQGGSSDENADNSTAQGAVKAKFDIPPATFSSSVTQKQQEISRMMGISADRVTISALEATSGVDHNTVEPWQGTKATITFDNPTSTSTNRKSAKVLADEFLQLRPGCDASDLKLKAVFLPANDKDCQASLFDSALASRTSCQAKNSFCDCYNPDSDALSNTEVEGANLFVTQMQRCFDVPAYQGPIIELCETLQRCEATSGEVNSVCAQVLVTQSASLVWIAAPSAVGFLLIVGVVWAKYKGIGIFKGKSKVKLGRH